jgi:hypothetical protein
MKLSTIIETVTLPNNLNSSKVKLKDCTFTLHGKPIKTLLWCNQQKRAKRNKPAKLNGVLVSEVQPFHEL